MTLVALKPKNSKSIAFTVREGIFTFWGILAQSAAQPVGSLKSASVQANVGLAAEAAVADPKGRQRSSIF